MPRGRRLFDSTALGRNGKSLLVIICDFDQAGVTQKLSEMGFKHGSPFIYADELFDVLDAESHLYIKNRKLAFWGTGTELSYFRENVTLENDVYIDSDINKRGMFIDGKEVIYPDDIRDWKNYFIIITTMKYYPEISEELHKNGLEENIDYIFYRKLLPAEYKLSEMLKRTIYAQPIQAPVCAKPFEYLEIAYGGNCFCCCPAWVDYKFGNISAEICNNIWNSLAAKIFRLSIINKTFCFC